MHQVSHPVCTLALTTWGFFPLISSLDCINLVLLELFIAFKWQESETNLNAEEFIFVSPLATEWVLVYAFLLRHTLS